MLDVPRTWACAVPAGFPRLASPEAEIAYRWEPSALKVGQFFAAEVIACRAPGPEAVREVVLDAPDAGARPRHELSTDAPRSWHRTASASPA